MSEWKDLPLYERTAKILKGLNDIEYLIKDPYLLNLDLWSTQWPIVRQFYGKSIYENPFVELVLVAGMGGSKSFLLSVFGAIETFAFLTMDLRQKYHLHPKSPILGLCVAGKEEQGKDSVFAHYAIRVQDSPFLMYQQPRVLDQEVSFDQHFFKVRLITSKSTTETGRRCKFILVDEADKFETTTGARSADEVARLLSKSTMTLKEDGHRFYAGSPMSPKSFLMRRLELSERIPKMLGIKRATWELNPNITRSDLQHDFDVDPIGALRDYAAEPTAGLDLFFRNLEIFDWTQGTNVLLEILNNNPIIPQSADYVLACDPSLRGDAFGVCLGHKHGTDIIIDGLYRFVPKEKREIDLIEVKDFLLKVISLLPVRTAVFDVWWYPEIQNEIRRKGVEVKNQIVRKTEYDTLKDQAYKNKVHVLKYDPLLSELSTLLITESGKVDHPRRGSKDVADTLALCVSELAAVATQVSLLSVQVV